MNILRMTIAIVFCTLIIPVAAWCHGFNYDHRGPNAAMIFIMSLFFMAIGILLGTGWNEWVKQQKKQQ